MFKSMKLKIFMILPVMLVSLLAAPAIFSADWSTTELHYQYGNLRKAYQGGGGASETGGTSVFTLQHSSGWKYGDNFFFFDHSNYGKTDVDSLNGDSGGDEIYGEFYSNFSLGKITGKDIKFGPINDIGLVAGFNFAPEIETLYYLPGVRMNCDERLFKYSAKEELEITEYCLQQQPASSLVQIWPAPVNTVYIDKELMQASLELAVKHDVSWHAHMSESQFEVEIHESVYGQRPVNWLHENGLLTDRTTFAHGIWLDEEEIQLLGKAKSTIIHNPVSNQYLASGTIKLGPLLKAGANIALGTDGVAVAGSDMFEAMKSAQMLQHLREYDAESTSAELMLHLACRNGGQMLRKNVGVLKVGALADFISVDLRGAHNQPATRAVCSLTSSVRGSGVCHVVVDGEHIVADGRSTKVDEEKVVADAIQASQQIIEKAGITDLVAAWSSPKHFYTAK